MKLKSSLVTLCTFLSLSASAYSQFSEWNTTIGGGANITTFDSANTESGVGYFFGLTQRFFFSDHVGLFSGAELIQRKLSFQSSTLSGASSSGSANYIDVPAGLSFQYGAWGSGLGHADVGVSYGIPLGDYSINGATFDARSFLSLLLSFSTAFPVSEDFYLGFKLAYKYALADSVDDTTGGGSKSRDFNFGIISHFTY
ncbi:outer membrane beta-barrel protein [bacterium]|nr:outer membrane beta-barrel protein [bacterium]